MPNVFVYGTLRKGEPNHHYLDGATCIVQQCWANGTLFDTDRYYPVVKESDLDFVFGELYEVSASKLEEIDKLEEYVEGAADNLYNRSTVTVYTDTGEEYTGIMYTAGHTLHHASDRIPSGDWLVYNYLQREPFLYFAYGSCMDDERFKKADVGKYFKNVKGKGILRGFAFQFSRSSDDGGKADIAQHIHEFVEGKVYEVPRRAVTYLYKREGVYSGKYRPAIVPITIEGSTYQALTFIGMEKRTENSSNGIICNGNSSWR